MTRNLNVFSCLYLLADYKIRATVPVGNMQAKYLKCTEARLIMEYKLLCVYVYLEYY